MITEAKQVHEDLEVLKKDVALIKYILTQEGELTQEAKIRLHKARLTPIHEYKEL